MLVKTKTNALLLKDGNNIRLFTWPSHHINDIQEKNLKISVEGKFLVNTVYLAYQLNNCIVIQDWHSGKQLYYFPVCTKYNNEYYDFRNSQPSILNSSSMDCQNNFAHFEVIAMGMRFILILLFDSFENWYKIGIFDIQRGKLISLYPISK